MRRVSVALLVVLGALVTGSPVRAAEPVAAAVTLDRASITVGDRISMSLVVDADQGYAVSDPRIARDVGAFEVLEVRATTKASRGAQVRYTYRYLITAWTTGDLVLPPVEVPYTAPDGSDGVAHTDPVAVHVASVIAANEAPTDIRPLKPQLALPETAWLRAERIALFAGGAIALTALAGLVFWLLLRRRNVVSLGEHLTPAQRAMRELGQLSEERLPEHGRTPEHYERLATSVRRYVVARYAIEPGRTSREMRIALERAGVDATQASAIYEILHEADEVRFGESTAYPAHAQNAVRAALEIVRRAASADEYEIAALQPQ